MRLIVGLGNPGPQYARNRHNVGFMAADAIARAHLFSPFRRKFSGEFAEGAFGAERAVLLKPMTYMNDSGRAVAEAARFFKAPVEDIVVIHDEIDLAPGRLKVKRGGGTAGHNGLESVAGHLGPDFMRVRIGVGHPGDPDRVADYVLSDFAKAEREGWVEKMVAALAAEFPRLIAGDEGGFMSRVAAALQPPKPPWPDKTKNGPAAKDS
ncbi:MAG: aminoacyl-tRNA hydrolase [Rhodospirillales bacterium]|nr:aminoacyl-tRNA hydrolase [Rhodospirillales bacterium]